MSTADYLRNESVVLVNCYGDSNTWGCIPLPGPDRHVGSRQTYAGRMWEPKLSFEHTTAEVGVQRRAPDGVRPNEWSNRAEDGRMLAAAEAGRCLAYVDDALVHARGLFVSLIPTDPQFGSFWRGFRPIEPLPELFSEDPDDIHMLLPIG